MKYFVRVIKYYIYVLVILSLMIAVLIAAKFVPSNISTLFVNGYDSLWQIALMMLVLAAVYPMVGYIRRDVVIKGSFEEVKHVVEKVMDLRGYELESQDGENLYFRKRRFADRLLNMFEDRISCARTISGYQLEGRGKEVVRICSLLSDKSE